MSILKQLALTAAFWGLSIAAQAADVSNLQQRWAQIHYEMPVKEQSKAYSLLADEARQLTQANPDSAPAHIWQGIILSSWASAEGGLGALSKVKQARTELEKALRLEPNALQGSAYTSLGALYYQVPGWPIGFGDHDKAAELLQKALALNPDGIDSNYFWADYLIVQKRYAEAKAALLKAQAAPPRPGRELADKGRQQEIRERLNTLE
ncbi:tetratricopeptide repeat protein [Halopseudomonas pelagia]|uniref:tetratricopeptide repeat protein n=1 Tax=Halopseudomonas pelagia TaxID=553151 RepID=UPI0003A0C22B|nr:tetratricopeptide repeat protein [Halopseudomonas pelagia]|tara:strand:- start:721 stop:1344 length:624 start_codon:yes stop_codon:yes gene_type:complete